LEESENLATAPISRVEFWANQILAEWRRSVEAIIETGRLIERALAELEYGQKAELWERLPFSQQTGSCLCRIAKDARIYHYSSKLPPAWRTIYELTKLDDETWGLALENGTINPNMGQHDAAKLARELKRQEKLGKLASPNPTLSTETRYPVIYADPPWDYSHGNRAHDNRAFDNQYQTMSLEDICSLPVKEISTDDSILFLWVTNPKVAEACSVIDAWGFTYKTNIAWIKDKIGMGFYVRQQHELLFLATRGNIPAPSPASRISSVFESPRKKHSQKPEAFYQIIERMYPGVPKIELFCRMPQKGWASWGNEVAS